MSLRNRGLSPTGTVDVEATQYPSDPTNTTATDVVELLRAYDRVLAAAEREPLLAWVRTVPPSEFSRRLPVAGLPRPTFLLRFFVHWHITSAVDALSRLLARRIALRDASDQDIADREAVTAFRAGLPPAHVRTKAAIFVLAVLTLGRLVLGHATAVLSDVPAFQTFNYDGGSHR